MKLYFCVPSRNGKLISNEKYSEFLNQNIELIKAKELISKLQLHLKDKSAEIKRLKFQVDYYKKKHGKEVPSETSKSGNRKDSSSEKVMNGRISFIFRIVSQCLCLYYIRIQN